MAEVAPVLDEAKVDFETRRGLIETLRLEATLSVENGEKTVTAWCVVGDKVYTLRPGESLL